MPTLEDMSLPCPLDICDGTGVLPSYEDEDDRPCPHTTDGNDNSDPDK